MPTVKANGINIYYETAGEGEPLVLICGLNYSLWQWRRMIPGLADHYEVIAFDNRGSGKTDKPPGPYNVFMLAADTVGLLDALDINRAIIVGHSMGGFVAQQMALSHPERVSKLVLASTNFGGPHHIPITPEAMAVLADRSGDQAELQRRGAAIACAPGFAEAHPDIIEEWVAYRLTGPVLPEAYQAQMAVGLALIAEDACFEHRLKNVKCPTVIFFGEHDRVVPPGNAALLAAKIPHSVVHILPDAGHMFPIEAPDAAVAALVKLLK